MSTIRELAIANLRNDIVYYGEQIERFAEYIERYEHAVDAFLDVDLPEDAQVSGYIYPSVTMPYSHARNDEIIGKLYEAIGEAPEFSEEELEGTRSWNLGAKARWRLGFESEFSSLDVRFDVFGEGAMCKTVQVGTRLVEMSVYKIECNQGV